MNPAFHPPLELLFDYAAGSLDPASALVVETHAGMCAECRAAISTFEAVGGEVLEAIEPAPMADDALARMMALIETAPVAEARIPDSGDPVLALLPPAIRRLGDRALQTTKWRSLVPGVRVLDLPVPTPPQEPYN